MRVAGLLLAAGEGRRMGTPKALLRDHAGVPYLDRTIGSLLDGGCASVTVVLGAAAAEARALLDDAGWTEDDAVVVVEAADWSTGMGASLRTGLDALATSDAAAALVTLVDLPDVGEDVVRRLLGPDPLGPGPLGPDTLTRASYAGDPGHPVLLGRDHWVGVAATAAGDRGARDYLAAHDVRAVECGDLATGRDVDRPTDL